MEAYGLVILAYVQGFYFAITGIWPLIHMKSVLMVTGPKTDLWLVKTVGVLVTVIGMVLILAAFREKITQEIFMLAVGSAVVLAAIDTIYALKRTIAKIYLFDAIIECMLILGWIFAR
jgi:hypothetical protein